MTLDNLLTCKLWLTSPMNGQDWQMLDGVLRGSTAMEISRHGEELREVLEKLSEEAQKIKR